TAAGQPDAEAVTVTDRSNVSTVLFCGWPGTTATPFTAASSSDVDLDLQGTGRRFVDQGHISNVQLLATDTPHVAPLGNAAPLYAIHQNGTLTVYNDFASWQADVAGRLAAGAGARFFGAVGKYDASSKTLNAGR